MNYVEGNVYIEEGKRLDKRGFVCLADGMLIDFGRRVEAGEVWLRGRAGWRWVYFFGKCPECGETVKKREKVLFITPYEIKENPQISRPFSIACRGLVEQIERRGPDFEIITLNDGENTFLNYVYDEYQIAKDSIFLDEGSSICVCGNLKEKKRRAYVNCRSCGAAAAVNEKITVIEPERITLEWEPEIRNREDTVCR